MGVPVAWVPLRLTTTRQLALVAAVLGEIDGVIVVVAVQGVRPETADSGCT